MIVVLEQWINFQRFKDLGVPIASIRSVSYFSDTKSEVMVEHQPIHVKGTVQEVVDKINAVLRPVQNITLTYDTKHLQDAMKKQIEAIAEFQENKRV
jgi:hypothetical protein